MKMWPKQSAYPGLIDELRGECQHASDVTCRVARVNLDVASFHPTKLLQSISKRADTIFAFLRTFGLREQNADPPGASRLR